MNNWSVNPCASCYRPFSDTSCISWNSQNAWLTYCVFRLSCTQSQSYNHVGLLKAFHGMGGSLPADVFAAFSVMQGLGFTAFCGILALGITIVVVPLMNIVPWREESESPEGPKLLRVCKFWFLSFRICMLIFLLCFNSEALILVPVHYKWTPIIHTNESLLPCCLISSTEVRAHALSRVKNRETSRFAYFTGTLAV